LVIEKLPLVIGGRTTCRLNDKWQFLNDHFSIVSITGISQNHHVIQVWLVRTMFESSSPLYAIPRPASTPIFFGLSTGKRYANKRGQLSEVLTQFHTPT
jgi:hypothetical protein